MLRWPLRAGIAVLAAVVVTPVVSAAPAGTAPTLVPSARTLAFGATLTLRGRVAAPAGTEVQIFSQACGFTGPVPIGTTHATAGGAYSFVMQPMLNASYFAQAGDAQSGPAPVKVSPTLQVRRVAGAKFSIDVYAGAGEFFTSNVILQAYDTAHKRWRSVGSGALKQNSDPGAITAVSTAVVKASVKHGTRLRAVMNQQAVGACYRPAASPPFVS